MSTFHQVASIFGCYQLPKGEWMRSEVTDTATFLGTGILFTTQAAMLGFGYQMDSTKVVLGSIVPGVAAVATLYLRATTVKEPETLLPDQNSSVRPPRPYDSADTLAREPVPSDVGDYEQLV